MTLKYSGVGKAETNHTPYIVEMSLSSFYFILFI